ncbi:GNAT family N-acetyltransferase [Caldalkalibacillus mannanilyticus]|uniref:GNAT family N-acetyltransferase n=1 Tax=Caldalkalibacillus mannanilyticus TaxID=1418 RepID=UPI000468078F|nr:GNAT family N-acetyltransferase [Caldalkalibacillus mannanilyticus]
MKDLRLVEPSEEYKAEYLNMIQEWEKTGERMVPFTLRYDCSDFTLFLQEMNHLKVGENVNERTGNSSTFWLVHSNKKVVGAVNIRHKLNDSLREIGGHIGYGIRPSERNKGFATLQLALALIKAREMGLDRVLVTCDKENIASAKTIVNNGGRLDSEGLVDGMLIQRYWIEMKE